MISIPPTILKKLVREPEIVSMLRQMSTAIDEPFTVLSPDETIVFGEATPGPVEKFPIEAHGQLVGYACGSEKVGAMVSALSCLAAFLIEKKALAGEILERFRELNLLYNVSEKIAASLDLDFVARLFIEEAKKTGEISHASLLLFNEESEQLEIIAHFGRGPRQMDAPVPGQGITGHAFLSGAPEIVNDIRSDPRYDKDVDPGASILCAPLKTRDKTIGVITVGSDVAVSYKAADLKLLTTLASLAASAIENSIVHKRLEDAYEELKVVNEAKDKVISHLSHEMKTPLAILQGAFVSLSSKIAQAGGEGFEKTVNRGLRNIERLLKIQDQTQDILDFRHREQKQRLCDLMENMLGFLSELQEEQPGHADVFRLLSEKIESVFESDEIKPEKIALDAFIDEVWQKACDSMGPRNLEIARHVAPDLSVTMDKGVLRKVCDGILKNAIENTPDEGRIVIRVYGKKDGVGIQFHDFGVGITETNRRLVFGGFFHTQDTGDYSSKRPYQFNAGGSGSDLLRIKIFSERHGFFINLKTSRCIYIPEDTDICPGKISDCEFVADKNGCLKSGGTIFSLDFPAAPNL